MGPWTCDTCEAVPAFKLSGPFRAHLGDLPSAGLKLSDAAAAALFRKVQPSFRLVLQARRPQSKRPRRPQSRDSRGSRGGEARARLDRHLSARYTCSTAGTRRSRRRTSRTRTTGSLSCSPPDGPTRSTSTAVGPHTTRTTLQTDGPDHLVRRCNALPDIKWP